MNIPHIDFDQGDAPLNWLEQSALIAGFHSLADFTRNGDDDITLFKNGGGASLDLITSRYILDKWRASQ